MASLFEEKQPWWRRLFFSAFGVLMVWVLVLWAIEIIDTVVLDDRLQQYGIRPRHVDGLDGIIWSPWLHSNFGHVASNTVPFLVLGWLTALRGLRFWLIVTVTTMVFGGGLVWLLAGGSNHIGASGLVFGYFGALMGAAIRSRRPASLAPAMVAIFLYGTILAGIVPQERISWEGHLFGLIVGLIVSLLLVSPPPPKPDDDDILYPWEMDEPWRIGADDDPA